MSRPPSKRKTEFPDPQEYRGNKELYKRLRKVIIDLRSQMTKGDDMRILIEFSNVINPGSLFDPGRLPLVSYSGRSMSQRRASCLLAKISNTILIYWAYQLDDQCSDPDIISGYATLEGVEKLTSELELIRDKGLKTFKIDGTEERGFFLVMPEPEPKPEKKEPDGE